MPFYNSSNPNRRDKILHASLLLFTSKGYANTSVHEIREKADVSIGLIYRYFKNKEEIAKALYSELLTDVTTGLQQLIDEHDSISEKCRAILRFYFERTEAHPEVVDYVLFFRHHEMFADAGAICAAQPAVLIGQMLTKAIEAGQIRKMHPAIAQTAIFGGAARLMQMRILGVLPTPLPDILEDVWKCSWKAVKPS